MPKRFRFRLEPVLRLRRRAVDEQMRVVGEQLRRLGRCRETMAKLRRQVDELLTRSRVERSNTDVDIGMQLQEQRWRLHLKRRIAKQAERLLEMAGVLRSAQAKLADLSKDVKVIEKLRERQYRTFSEEQSREERLEADEQAMQIFLRRARFDWESTEGSAT